MVSSSLTYEFRTQAFMCPKGIVWFLQNTPVKIKKDMVDVPTMLEMSKQFFGGNILDTPHNLFYQGTHPELDKYVESEARRYANTEVGPLRFEFVPSEQITNLWRLISIMCNVLQVLLVVRCIFHMLCLIFFYLGELYAKKTGGDVLSEIEYLMSGMVVPFEHPEYSLKKDLLPIAMCKKFKRKFKELNQNACGLD